MTNEELAEYSRRRYKAYGIKFNRVEEAEVINWIEAQRKKGNTATDIFRYLILRQIAKEKKAHEH